MGVDPTAVDAETCGEFRCIDHPDAGLRLALLHQRDDAVGNRIDVGRVESHVPQAAQTVPVANGSRCDHGHSGSTSGSKLYDSTARRAASVAAHAAATRPASAS